MNQIDTNSGTTTVAKLDTADTAEFDVNAKTGVGENADNAFTGPDTTVELKILFSILISVVLHRIPLCFKLLPNSNTLWTLLASYSVFISSY